MSECRKKCYFSRKAARQAKNRLKDELGITSAYQCPICSSVWRPVWHLTSLPRDKNEQLARKRALSHE